MSTITIVYFSGTGGTRRCAKELSELLTTQGNSVQTLELRGRAQLIIPPTDKLIIMYPVYFMNAPLPVQEFAYKLEQVNGTYAAVVSVSAGGEVTPNLACRMRINAILASKGYNVVYENMLVMPANCLKKPHENVAAALLKVLPYKLQHIAADISSGKVRRPELDLASHVSTQFGRIPQKFSGLFALFFKCTDACTACGLCARSCPRDNIYVDKDRVGWEGYCAACMHCFYACPQQAIKMSLIEQKFVIAGGYNIDKLAQTADTINLSEINDIAKLHTQSSERGIRKYLLEDVYIGN